MSQSTAAPQDAEPDRSKTQRLLRDLQQAPVMIWTTGLDRRCDWVNAVWLAFTGRPLEAQVGNGWWSDVHPQDVERRKGILDTSFDAKVPYTLDFRLRARDGSHRWMLETAAPRYESDGSFAGYVGSCVDIHERKTMEDQLAERARVLRQTDRRKDEFLAILSHELRNPLAPIANAAAILRAQGSTDPTVVMVRNIVERSVGQLSRLVNDLLEVTRFTQGRIVLQYQPVRLDEMIDFALEGVQSTLRSHGHTLRVDLPQPGAEVNVDKVRLAQAVTNVVSNACKFTPEGGLIEVSAEVDNDLLRIRVKDSGQGIVPEFLPNLFNLFAQQDSSLARTQGGLGVGLTIAKRIAHLHGGDLEAYSEGSGRGAEFVFTLPLEPLTARRDGGGAHDHRDGHAAGDAPAGAPTTADAHEPLRGNSVPGAAVTAGCRVLVIEDNPDARESLRMLLELWGNEVATASDGVAGLQLAESFRPQIVLCDIGLPGTDGFALIEPLRRKLAGQPTVFAALTSYGAAPHKARALQAGFDSFLVKPLHGEAFDLLRRSYAEHLQHPNVH